MSHSSNQDGDYEKLSKAITEAVLSSPKVRKMVEEIQERDDICPQSFMVLVLKLESLTEGLSEVEETSEKPKKKSRRSKKETADPAQYIDGKKLSVQEIEFEEFKSKRFDAEAWLKKNGLIF
ncbi:MAG: hypothetical protein GWM98_13970 [Nitrospinaceae bacterium]|nr:hypothetical protein [Nitrospinaceae bacterium]NIR55379.1 hypothetical protein [Nitrospinaceae bacterium]NIS85816.1 hypothetical protein [Nitrospinaceae bacterium]NIT82665.1 hypothetical protein [Nitrospinaceae bacterium]NIU44873.1 hypothetical protein [Nitrospinaceae bacterium]